MQTIKDAVEILRQIKGTPAEIGRAWIVADELEALLKQDHVAEYIAECEVARIAHIPIGTRLYKEAASAEPVNARLLDALKHAVGWARADVSCTKQDYDFYNDLIAASEQAKPAPEGWMQNGELVEARLSQIVSGFGEAKALAEEAIPCIRAMLAAAPQPGVKL